jgi:carbon storage regulator
MLVLMRREGDGICIGDDVRVVVVGIVRGHVRLGIEAPDDVEIDREEVRAAKIERRKREAAEQAVQKSEEECSAALIICGSCSVQFMRYDGPDVQIRCPWCLTLQPPTRKELNSMEEEQDGRIEGATAGRSVERPVEG